MRHRLACGACSRILKTSRSRRFCRACHRRRSRTARYRRASVYRDVETYEYWVWQHALLGWSGRIFCEGVLYETGFDTEDLAVDWCETQIRQRRPVSVAKRTR